VGKNNKCSEVSKERGDLQTGIVNIMETLGTKNSDSGKKYHVLVEKPHPLKGSFRSFIKL
jgi:hypothetical protein